jgi:hypothetical protein
VLIATASILRRPGAVGRLATSAVRAYSVTPDAIALVREASARAEYRGQRN